MKQPGGQRGEQEGGHLHMPIAETFRGDVREFRIVARTRRGEVPLVEMVFTRRVS